MKKLHVAFLCIAGFVLGYVLVRAGTDNVGNAEIDGEDGYDRETITSYSEFFPDEYYKLYHSQKNKNITYIERMQNAEYLMQKEDRDGSEVNSNKLYTIQDAENIIREILDISYDLKIVSEKYGMIRYKEFKDGYETGASAHVLFDDEGYIEFMALRKGEIYEVDEDRFIGERTAYKIALKAIAQKYSDKNLTLKDSFDTAQFDFEVKYIRDHGMCYCFEVEGAVDAQWDDELSIFYFYPLINVYDETDVEIASTFCY